MGDPGATKSGGCARCAGKPTTFPATSRTPSRNLTRAIALKPDATQTYYDRGLAYFHSRAHDAALADFGRAIQLDPKFTAAYLNRGVLRLIDGDFEQAASDLSIVIELDRRNATAYRLRSRPTRKWAWP